MKCVSVFQDPGDQSGWARSVIHLHDRFMQIWIKLGPKGRDLSHAKTFESTQKHPLCSTHTVSEGRTLNWSILQALGRSDGALQIVSDAKHLACEFHHCKLPCVGRSTFSLALGVLNVG
jgi:hypothetical protein